MRSAHDCCVLALAAFAAAALPGDPARAATATLVYEEPIPGLEPEPAYSLSVESPAGEANAITLAQDGEAYTVRDAGAPLSAGQGCEAVAPGEARCPTPRTASVHAVFVATGDGDDRVDFGALPASTFVEARGGAGADAISAGPGEDLLLGGSGTDSLSAGAGHDRLDGGRGDDALDGGTGHDRVLYETRRSPVRVDLSSGSGGAAGEHDTYLAVEDIAGGRGADHLAGDGIQNVIIGGAGDGRDTILGRGGDDVLSGHRVAGGPGDDSVGGRIVSCGEGRDVVRREPGHMLRGPFPGSCETVVAIFVTLAPDPVRTSRRAAHYAVDCLASRCRGRLELRDSRGRLGIARFSLRRAEDPARPARVRVRLARRPAERVVALRVAGERAYQRDWFRTRLG